MIRDFNPIYVRRKQKVMVEEGQGELPKVMLATFLKNLDELGYIFSMKLIEKCQTLSEAQFLAFCMPLLSSLKKIVGDDKEYNPMYPNFPDQVMTMEESHLFWNAMFHYYTLEFPSTTDIVEREMLEEENEKKMIDVGNEQEFEQMIQNLIASKTPISLQDREDIALSLASHPDSQKLLPVQIPLKENIGFVIAQLLQLKKIEGEQVASYFRTATDVLRLAVALSEGDISLAASTKFKKFSRHERRFLLALLEQCTNIEEDMLRYRKPWIRLGEILHPSEYQMRFPKVAEAFHKIRNQLPIWTFSSQIEQALATKNIKKVYSLLSERPGEFARRLDHVLRTVEDKMETLDSFAKVADQVPTPLLLTLQSHFANRSISTEERVFFPKGNTVKYVVIDNELPLLKSSICDAIVSLCNKTLLDRFASLPDLGKVYINPELQNYMVPLSSRSASQSLRTVGRGSRLSIPDGDTIRFFLWWKEGYINGEYTGDVDIDLSASIYSEDWQYKEHLSFTNLKLPTYESVHSGDIVSAPNGASEFIDIHLPSVLRNDSRYIILSIYCFSEHIFSSLPECYAGWMVRQRASAGKIYEPSTVQDKVDLASNARIAVPLVIDAKERKVFWVDMGLNRELNDRATIERNKRSIAQLGKWITTLQRPNLYDLFRLHAKARGNQVDQPEEADTLFDIHKGITPFDTDTIAAYFLK
ncbi:TerD family protein [Shimazuella kribbensis]|uniref:TerD family protein n=1 Tax=Shimazuella kribbensis TaxID=139808 RepID=UPI00055A1C9D|nr:TerD family protein [Shimazuella kribbensis]